MTILDKKRKELELVKVNASRCELEFRILEKEDEIKRLKENIKLQDEYIIKINKELEEHSSNNVKEK